ncbi:MAG: YfhO family protein [Phycisphaerae bacterium]
MLIIFSPVVILAGAWRLGGVSALEDDLIYYLPVRQYIGERIAGGDWPLWNPFTRMGMSIAADPQSGLWYPSTWLFAVLPPLVAYPVTIILHFALAGMGMYRFLRSLGRYWQAALFGAIAFEMSGYLVAHRAHLTIHHAAAWLPLIFYEWQRFSTDGRYKHFARAGLALGAQMLVQHVQVTIIGLALLTGYTLMVLRPRRPRLIWEFPLGVAAGILVSAIQFLPTLLHLSATGRATPSYATFVENSWTPLSALLLLFPMLFGNRTPNLWHQPWWGISHFCEQSAYGTILILVLALASYWLLRGHQRPSVRLASLRAQGTELQRASSRPWNREILFWWIASFVVLLLALGELTPLAKLLFHVPLYRSLRVPARWILGWSLAMPILASAVISSVLSSQPTADQATGGIRFVVKRILPINFAICVLLMVIARWQANSLESAFAGRWNADVFFSGLRAAIRPGNPAIWWPILLAAATGVLLLRWANRGSAHQLALLFLVMMVDAASVAAFIDVDIRTYQRSDLRDPPELARAIAATKPDDGHRLLVPRFSADYDRPIEVLWPQTNVQRDISTFHGYGPLWPLSSRLLLRFMPWGSSQEMLSLLRDPRLLKSLGVRFIAARSRQERAIVEAALWPDVAAPNVSPIEGTETPVLVRAGQDLLWPVNIPSAGIYELEIDATPTPGDGNRWFVRLETEDVEQIEEIRMLTPEDLAVGPRRMRFQFRCDQAYGPIRVRVKAEHGRPVTVSHAAFGCVAAPLQTTPAASAATEVQSPWSHVANLEGNIALYELRDANPLLFWAERVTPVTNLLEAVNLLQARRVQLENPTDVVVEEHGQLVLAAAPGPAGSLRWRRPSPEELLVVTDNATAAFLVFNETYDDGWTVEIDGLASRPHRVNALVQGVAVPPGRHQIIWRYRPVGLKAGIGLTVLSLLTLLAPLATRPRRLSVRRH